MVYGLEFRGCHGVLPAEKVRAQLFQVDLDIYLDLRPAGQQDELALTVDYALIFALVKDVVEMRSFDLLEALAENIAEVLLRRFVLIQAVEVAVKKPDAPIMGSFDFFGVKIWREK